MPCVDTAGPTTRTYTAHAEGPSPKSGTGICFHNAGERSTSLPCPHPENQPINKSPTFLEGKTQEATFRGEELGRHQNITFPASLSRPAQHKLVPTCKRLLALGLLKNDTRPTPCLGPPPTSRVTAPSTLSSLLICKHHTSAGCIKDQGGRQYRQEKTEDDVNSGPGPSTATF